MQLCSELTMDAGQPQQVIGYPETLQATLTQATMEAVGSYMETSLNKTYKLTTCLQCGCLVDGLKEVRQCLVKGSNDKLVQEPCNAARLCGV